MKRILRAIVGTVSCLASFAALASTCDLTIVNSSCLVTSNGVTALYQQGNLLVSGSGVFPAFNRISDANAAIVQGYNTPTQGVFNNTSDATFNRNIHLSDVPFLTVGVVQYREFLLDINQINATPGNLLSLSEVQIFATTTPSQGTTVFTDLNNNFNNVLALANSSLLYRLDVDKAGNGSDVNNDIKLNYSLQSGSGQMDMILLVPNSVFQSQIAANPYIVLYSKFGDATYCTPPGNQRSCGQNNDGFEEWAMRASANFPCLDSNGCIPGGGAPEPGTLVLLGVGLAGLALRRRGKSLSRPA